MKGLRKPIWCATWLLCVALAFGHSPTRRPVAGYSEWSKSENGFSAFLVLSDRPDDVLSTWTTSTVALPVRMADTVTRGVPIVAFVFFAGCKADENGLCNASADFTILKPDGSVYVSFSDRDLWKQKPVPPRGMLRLSAEYVGAVIEPEDPLGRYEFRVSVHDLNGGTTLELRRAFTAIERDR